VFAALVEIASQFANNGTREDTRHVLELEQNKYAVFDALDLREAVYTMALLQHVKGIENTSTRVKYFYNYFHRLH